MKIAYSFDKDVGNYHYGKNHPMKPHRSTVVNSLIHSYGLDKHMDILEIETNCLDSYHNDEKLFSNKIYNDDCPHFPGLKEFCSKYTNGTLLAANSLLHYDIAINWSGGMHHGKKNEPSGFCYKNDIVIAIQRLLKSFDKVLYIDIDIHHGDAVEEAFGFNERVLTCSFHKYGDGFFPGTGTLLTNYFSKDKLTTDSNTIDIKDLKSEYPFVKKNTENVIKNVTENVMKNDTENFMKNDTENVVKNVTTNVVKNVTENFMKNDTENVVKNVTKNVIKNVVKNVINVPLRNGIDDWSYKYIFQPIVSNVMRKFEPSVIVLQCGADSLGEDRLGCFNLSVQGHGECVEFVKSFNKKMLVVGGGGYTLHNVARAWTYETSLLIGQEISPEIPPCPYSDFFFPTNNLFPDFRKRHENENTKSYLDSISGYIHNILDRF